MELVIRTFTDQSGVEELLRSAIGTSSLSDADGEVAATLALSRTVRSLALVASESDEQDRAIGAVFASLEEDGSVAFVRWLVVAPDRRRAGIGTALMDALERSPGVARVHGMVDRTDPVARRFWHSRGWRRRHERPRRVLMGADVRLDHRDAAA